MRLFSTLYLPLTLYFLLHGLIAAPTNTRAKAGAAMDPNGSTHTAPVSLGPTNSGSTTPGVTQVPSATP